ncbi:hypothetical protein L5515_003167 [Caenorhabditis briggsae]|uniref:F-box associated domain-containing protein n=1 Tax=Caenorhabditis briggsae TaxID=6238 RepID=A0AAE9JA01_CAEBR|nr:hypothetical protein L5515_003167 [Caenorhabditis briggsae]
MADPVRNEKPKPDFRLMDLNFWCRLQMISHWDIKKQIAFSHCSKESFKLVKSLNQKPRISIRLENWNWITVDVGNLTCLIKLVDEDIAYPGYATPIKFGLNARDAFVHLCEMYHHKELTVRLNRYSITPFDAFRNVIHGFPIQEIKKKDYMEDMLEFLLPSKTLLISENPYDSYQELRDQILQFDIDTSPLEGRTAVTTQHFKGFIRKWIKSEANPKFKTILIHSGARGIEENYQQKILDGLLFKRLPNDWKYKNVPKFTLWCMPAHVNGIFEVQQEADGQKSSEFETLILQRLSQIDLLDLKAINTEISLTIRPTRRNLPLNTQQFRGFIEKWIKSEVYPKFKTIVIHAGSRDVEENFQERILDGLLYQQLPNDWTCENVPHGTFWGKIFQVSGSFEVQREADGQKAVISFASFGKAVLWKFFVV